MSEQSPALSNMATILPKEIVEIAEAKGKEFNLIKTNQIRNFYNSIVEMKQDMKNNAADAEVYSKLILLKPKLAYAAGRQTPVKGLYWFVEAAVNGIESPNEENSETFKKSMKNFFDLIESLVAYHKFHGGN